MTLPFDQALRLFTGQAGVADFSQNLAPVGGVPGGGSPTPTDPVAGDLGTLLRSDAFQNSGVEDRQNLFNAWKKSGLPQVLVRNGLAGNKEGERVLRKQAQLAVKEHLRSDGFIGTVKNNFLAGVEDAGLGLSVARGAAPQSMASDLLDTAGMPPDADMSRFMRDTQAGTKAVDDAKGFVNTATALGRVAATLATNPTQTAGLVARSLGGSLPVGAAGAAVGGAAGAVAGGVGSVPGAVIGYLAGSAGTNITLEMGAALREAIAEKYPTFNQNDKSPANAALLAQMLTQDPSIVDTARVYGGKKGATIAAVEGAVDALTLGAGRVLRAPVSALGRVASGTAKVGVQGLSEGVGEYVGTAAAGGTPSLGEAAMEGMLATPSGAVDVALMNHAGGRPAPAPIVEPTAAPSPAAAPLNMADAFVDPDLPLTPEEQRAFAASSARASMGRADPVGDMARGVATPPTSMAEVDSIAQAHQATTEAALMKQVEDSQAAVDSEREAAVQATHRAEQDRAARKDALNGLVRAADDDLAELEQNSANARGWLGRRVGDMVSQAQNMDAAQIDQLFAATMDAASVWQPHLSDAQREQARLSVHDLVDRANAIAAQLDLPNRELWEALQPPPTIPDASSTETSAQLESFIKERRDGNPQINQTTEGLEGGTVGDQTLAGGTASTVPGAGADQRAGTAGRGRGGAQNTGAAASGRTRPDAVQSAAQGAETGVRTNSTAPTFDEAKQHASNQPTTAGTTTGGTGQRGADDPAGAGGGVSGQPTGAGASTGGVAPKRRGPAPTDWARKPSEADKAAAQQDWDEEYGYAAEQYVTIGAGDQVPFADLPSALQEEWVLVHRDPSLNTSRDATAQRILRAVARIERAEAASKVARENAQAEVDSDIRRADIRRAAGSRRSVADVVDDVGEDADMVDTPQTPESSDEQDPTSMWATSKSAPARPVSLQDAQDAVTQALAGLTNAPPVNVVLNPAAAGVGHDPTVVPKGGTLGDGSIYVFSDAHSSIADVVRTVFHELLHRGVKALFPTNQAYGEAMLRLAAGDGVLRKYAKEWKESDDGIGERTRLVTIHGGPFTGDVLADYEAHAVEEGLATISEELLADKRAGSRLGATMTKFVTWLADTAEKLGLNDLANSVRGMTYTEAERFVTTAVNRSGAPVQGGGPRFRSDTRSATTYEELLHQATTGEAPVSQQPGRLAGYRDWVLDSTAPFLDMVKDRRHEVYRAFNTALNQQAVRMTDAAQMIDTDVLKPMAKAAKAVNVAPEQFVADVGNYALLRYAPQGNEELRLRHEANLAEAQVAVATAQREVANDPTNRAYRATLASVEADLREAQTWLDRHSVVDQVVRGAPGVGPLHLQRHDGDRFIGGLTTAEANAVRQALEQRYGTSLPELVRMADLLTGAMRATTQRAIDAGVIRQDELPGYSTSQDWVPTTGTGEIDDGTQSELLFNSGLQGLKDKQRKGRSTISDNAVEAVVRKILSLERQIAMRPFTEVLAAHDGQLGIHVVPSNDPRKGIPYKREADLDPADPSVGTRTQTMKIVFDSEKAMDAVLGANRERANSVALATVGRYTRWTAYMVTRAVPVFAPISGFKDAVERAVNIIANSGERVRPVQLLAAVTAGYVSPANMWAAGKSITGKWGNSQAEKDAQELMQHTGFLTRNTVLSNDMDALAADVARASGGLKHKSTVMKWLHSYNEMFERTAQLSVYRALIAQGLTPAVAADTMLEAMNLNKTGRFSPVAQVFFPFFGARMTGANQVLRNMGSVRGMATLATMTAAGMLLYAMSSALGGDDPGDDEEGLAQNRMDSLSGVTLARGIPIWTGEDGKFVKIPVPYGLGFVGWNLAVALSRLSNGTFTPAKALEHAGVALMDEVSPFAPSPADIMKYPGWWTLKTVTPEILKKLINVVANRNDFGGPAGVAVLRDNVPAYMQGSRKTDDTWHTLARVVGDATGGFADATPEQWRELVSMVVPLATQVVKAVDADEDEAGGADDSGLVKGAMALAGGGRLVGKLDSTLTPAFYQAREQAQADSRQAHAEAGRPPRSKRGEKRADTEDWLDGTTLTDVQRRRVLALQDYESGLTKLMRVRPEPGDTEAAADNKASLHSLQQDFLREIAQ